MFVTTSILFRKCCQRHRQRYYFFKKKHTQIFLKIKKMFPKAQSSGLYYLIFVWITYDISFFIKHGNLHKYANDNTLSYAEKIEMLLCSLERESAALINWFWINCYHAKSYQLQPIAVGNEHLQRSLFLTHSQLNYRVMRL